MKPAHREYHRHEAERIERELAALGPEFAEDGVVRYVLRERIEQERARAAGKEPCTAWPTDEGEQE